MTLTNKQKKKLDKKLAKIEFRLRFIIGLIASGFIVFSIAIDFIASKLNLHYSSGIGGYQIFAFVIGVVLLVYAVKK